MLFLTREDIGKSHLEVKEKALNRLIFSLTCLCQLLFLEKTLPFPQNMSKKLVEDLGVSLVIQIDSTLGTPGEALDNFQGVYSEKLFHMRNER